MNKEELLPFIMQDADEFWQNSVNPINSDSLFIMSGITNFNEALSFKNTDNGRIVLALFENTYLISGEYIITFMSAMVLTNRRLFTFYTGTIKSIALKNLLKYEHQSDCLLVEYLENGVKQSFRITTTFLNSDSVNNVLAKHQNDIITEQELVLLSDTKIVLDAKYAITISISTHAVSNHSVDDAKEYERKGNRNGLILVLIIVSLIGGCGYFIHNWSKSYENSGQAYGGSHAKEKQKCSWCGGVGRVGYAGDSKAQVERTGMGLGNPCTVCTGTGYIGDDK